MAPLPENPPAESSIIIIHPGSLNLRIGRSSDLNPITLTHVIARRRTSNNLFYQDDILPHAVERTKEEMAQFEQCRKVVSHTLQSCLQSNGQKRYATAPQQISAFNRRAAPEYFDEEIRCFKSDEETVFCDNVLNLSNSGDYNIHFPIRRGELNLHPGIGGSLTSVLTDLQAIWEYVLTQFMGIDLLELGAYKAVLVIPVIYNRQHLKHLTTLLLTKMGFGACFLVQDHVAGSFGAGLAACCVVDVGDQKTSISCVEDGISHSATRCKLMYGGGDVTQTYFSVLKKCAFPYKECNATILQDAMLLKTLKENFCHVNLDICGSQEKVFIVPSRIVGQKSAQYTIQVGDECVVAPLSLFHTELLGCNKIAAINQLPTTLATDPEDIFDAEYIRETGRRGFGGGRDHLDLQSGADVSGTVTLNENQEDDLELERDVKEKMEKAFTAPGGEMLGLDQAVLQSIERCPNDELKRKMYSCILVVGGGFKFAGISKWLQNRVALQIPYMYRSETLDIITNPKDLDPAMTVWKGAAVMSCLESAPELWVTKGEYSVHGLRILREKAVFVW